MDDGVAGWAFALLLSAVAIWPLLMLATEPAARGRAHAIWEALMFTAFAILDVAMIVVGWLSLG